MKIKFIIMSFSMIAFAALFFAWATAADEGGNAARDEEVITSHLVPVYASDAFQAKVKAERVVRGWSNAKVAHSPNGSTITSQSFNQFWVKVSCWEIHRKGSEGCRSCCGCRGEAQVADGENHDEVLSTVETANDSGSIQEETVEDKDQGDTLPTDETDLAAGYRQKDVTVSAKSGARIRLPEGSYAVAAWGSWSYGSGRWYGPGGDPYKTERGHCLCPRANYGQLIIKTDGRWNGYFQGMELYHKGGVLKLEMNDRSNSYADNQGTITVRLRTVD